MSADTRKQVRWARLLVWEGPEDARRGQRANSWLPTDGSMPAAGGTMTCVVLTEDDWELLECSSLDLVDRVKELRKTLREAAGKK